MKVGDYIRTKFGQIGKLEHIGEYNINIDFGKHIRVITKIEDYKSSPNIIDLIEVGDYVNGHKVIYTIGNINKRIYVEYVNMDELLEIKLEQITSIVTKEQFESMEYKIEEK